MQQSFQHGGLYKAQASGKNVCFIIDSLPDENQCVIQFSANTTGPVWIQSFMLRLQLRLRTEESLYRTPYDAMKASNATLNLVRLEPMYVLYTVLISDLKSR